MITAKRLVLDNVVLFQHAELDLAEPGVVLVQGHNLQSKLSAATNAVGKSLLMSAIPNCRYHSLPLAVRKKSRRDLLQAPTSTIRFEFVTEDGTEIALIQTPSTYTVVENGKDLGIKRIDLAQQYVDRHFPINMAEFYTTTYLTTQRPCEFLARSPAERQQFLLDVFSLHFYEKVRQQLAVQLQAVSKKETEVEVVAKRLQAQLAVRDQLQWSAADHATLVTQQLEQQTLATRLNKLQAQTHRLQTKIDGLQDLLQLDLQLNRLRKLYCWELPPAKLQVVLRNLRTKLLQQEKQQAMQAGLVQAMETAQQQQDQLVLPTTSQSEVIEQLVQVQEQQQRVQQKYMDQKKLAATEQRLRDQLTQLTQQLDRTGLVSLISGWNLARLEQELDHARTLQQAHQLLQGGHTADCPLCGAELDGSVLQTKFAAAKQLVANEKPLIAYLQSQQQLSQLAPPPAGLTRQCWLRKAEHKLARLERHQQAWQRHQQAWQRYTELQQQIEQLGQQLATAEQVITISLAEWQPVASEPTTSAQLDQWLELCQQILQQLAAKTSLATTYGLDATLPQSEYRQQLQLLQTKLQQLQEQQQQVQHQQLQLTDQCQDLSHRQTQHNFVVKDIQQLQAQLDAATVAVASKRLLQALTSAYGSRGLKNYVLQRLCKTLETNLNTFAPFCFAEPMRFEIQVVKGGVTVLAQRSSGLVSDIRLLSGAESACFRLTLMLSLLGLIPSSRRVNFAILDEADYNMGPSLRTHFITHFLPQLQQVIPTIFVVTPNAAGYDSVADRVLTITKNKNKSTLMWSS